MSQQADSDTNGGFGHKAISHERAFDLRDPYKLNRAPLLRGGKQRYMLMLSGWDGAHSVSDTC